MGRSGVTSGRRVSSWFNSRTHWRAWRSRTATSFAGIRSTVRLSCSNVWRHSRLRSYCGEVALRARRMPLIWIWASIVYAFHAGYALPAETPKPQRHVVIVVWDGMRPDFVNKDNTTALWKLAQEGVIF